MAMTWKPSLLGRQLTSSPDWSLRLEGLTLFLTANGRSLQVNVEEENSYRIRSGLLWTDITFYPGQAREVLVDGLPNAQGSHFSQAIGIALKGKRARDIAAHLKGEQARIDAWQSQYNDQVHALSRDRRWFTHEMWQTLSECRPNIDLPSLEKHLQDPAVRTALGHGVSELETSLKKWRSGPVFTPGLHNTILTESELVACKDLFDRVEKSPLTREQATAVICFDNRVQVVASAGSGKTSTMVAKAAYAIHRGYTTPDRIVLLAFNKQAAEELKERAAKAFERLGMEGVTVEASTFHALGLRIIGKATKEKPDIPDWATDAAGGVRKLTEIVNHLKDHSTNFRNKWDLFRFVFGRVPTSAGSSEPNLMGDGPSRISLVTNQGERVKSYEEWTIANFLFMNGVAYKYEQPYEHRTASEEYRQYKPDFFYPELGLYHEHFALNAKGEAPNTFDDPKKYVEGVIWKRALHKEKGTSLFETTSYGIGRGDDFQRIERELTSRGVVLDPNPDREIPKGGLKPLESAELIGLVRTFMSHAKSNCLSMEALHQRLDKHSDDVMKQRHRIFLDLVGPIIEAWDGALAAEDGIDFEDMLNQAAEHLESGRYEAPYDLVMADEFQDASAARARLCRAMVRKPGRFLFAVGDDWQSINRFAGADVSVMTGFRQFFGHGQVLKLEQTFRCPQALCDISSTFVTKNPAQISKKVRSNTPAQGPVLQAFQVDDKDKLADAIDQFIVKLAKDVREGKIPPGRNGKVSVYVLGRYNADRQYVPANPSRFSRQVEVSFLTIHRSKGSEADYIILPEMLSVQKGRSFPNTRTDDPILSLAMPDGDTFPLGEERRLFYVALTRARRSVAMFTARGHTSSFLFELVNEGAVELVDKEGKSIKETVCPSCKQGVLVLRTGSYGEFRSCSNYPACTYKPDKKAAASPFNQPAANPKRPLPNILQTIQSSSPSLAAPQSERAKDARLTLSAVLAHVNRGVQDFNKKAVFNSAVLRATSDLKQHIQAERFTIEAAIKRAASDIELDGLMKDPGFREAYREVAKASGLDKTTENSERNVYPVPSSARMDRHADPEIEAAITRAIHELFKERQQFIAASSAQLQANPTLRQHFLKNLSRLKGEHYLAVLDPTSTWTKTRDAN